MTKWDPGFYYQPQSSVVDNVLSSLCNEIQSRRNDIQFRRNELEKVEKRLNLIIFLKSAGVAHKFLYLESEIKNTYEKIRVLEAIKNKEKENKKVDALTAQQHQAEIKKMNHEYPMMSMPSKGQIPAPSSDIDKKLAEAKNYLQRLQQEITSFYQSYDQYVSQPFQSPQPYGYS